MREFVKILTVILLLYPAWLTAQINSYMDVNKDITPSKATIVPEPGEVVLIPGTNVSLVPPEHYLVSEQLPGLVNFANTSTVQVAEIIGTSYIMIAEAMTKEHFAEQDFVLIEQKDIDLECGQSGILYRLKFKTKDGIEFERLILFAGDYNNTMWISVNYPAVSYNMLYDKIEESLLTAQYHKGL